MATGLENLATPYTGLGVGSSAFRRHGDCSVKVARLFVEQLDRGRYPLSHQADVFTELGRLIRE